MNKKVAKILFVEPPLSYEHAEVFPRHPPHYAAYAAAFLEQAGHRAVIIDAFFEGLQKNEVIKRIVGENADAVIFLPFDYTRETPTEISLELADAVKGEMPDAFLGIAGSMDEDYCRRNLKRCDSLDFAIVGEYELPALSLAEHLSGRKTLEEIPGLIYRSESNLVSPCPSAQIEKLDELPFPAWHLVDFHRYVFIPHRFRYAPFYPLLAGRGCPFGCLTCKEARLAKITKYRLRSVENVIEEIQFAKQNFGAREIQFSDATFGLDKKWVFDLCNAMIEEKLEIPWSALSRVDVLDEPMLQKMAEAGCWNLLYGIESGNQSTLERINKGFSIDQVRKTVTATQKAGIETTGSFILGLPGENEADAMRTIEFAKSLDLDYAQFFLLKFIGQTSDLSAWGSFTESWDYGAFDFRGPVFLPEAIPNLDVLKRLQKKAYRSFYFRPGYIWKKRRRL